MKERVTLLKHLAAFATEKVNPADMCSILQTFSLRNATLPQKDGTWRREGCL